MEKKINFTPESLIKAMKENKIFYLNIEVDVIDTGNCYCCTRNFHFSKISMCEVLMHENNVPVHMGEDLVPLYGKPEVEIITAEDWDNPEGEVFHTFTTHTWRKDGEVIAQIRAKSSYMRECDCKVIPNSIVYP